jgi:thymidylate synthase (FAD)
VRIVKPYSRLLRVDGMATGPEEGNTLQFVEWAGRVSHRSEDEQKETSWLRFIENVVMKHGDWSIVEHVTMSVEFLVDRGITHEIVRHRLFSFTQESTRFVNYQKKMPPSFVYPKTDVVCQRCLDGIQPLSNVRNNGQWTHVIPTASGSIYEVCAYDSEWLDAIDTVEKKYIELLAKGWRPQEARSVFPNALASKMVMTGNLRNWRHFFRMRTTLEAHPQMRQVTIPLLEQVKKAVPLIYDDIQPNSRQIDNLKLPC